MEDDLFMELDPEKIIVIKIADESHYLSAF